MQFLDNRYSFVTKITGFKGKRFYNFEKNLKNLDKFKYLNILCYCCQINTQMNTLTIFVISF